MLRKFIAESERCPGQDARPPRYHRERRIHQSTADSRGVPQGQPTRLMRSSHLCTQRLY